MLKTKRFTRNDIKVAEINMQDNELVALDLIKAYNTANNRILVRNTRSGKVSAVSSDVFRVLASCGKFKTIAEHVRELQRGFPALRGQAEGIEKVLRDSLEGGLLVPASQLCARINGNAGPDASDNGPDSAGEVVAIITWERPAELRRLLESMCDNWRSETVRKIYVIDDSRNRSNAARNREIVDFFAAGRNVPVTYFGQAEQQELISRLVQKIPQHEDSIRFLADQANWTDYWSSGLSRNIALLLSVGCRLVVFDDDSLFKVYEAEPATAGVAFSNDGCDARFYGDDEQWRGFAESAEFDPVSGHLSCLGMPLQAALKKQGIGQVEPADLAAATMEDISRLHASSPILITQCGTLGHAGTEANTWLIELSEAAHRRMIASSESVTNAIRNDNLWTGHALMSFSPIATMSLVTGLDNRRGLPPYFPILRGEDKLFGYMVSYVYPDSVVMDYPWAIPHLPASRRDRPLDESDYSREAKFPMFFFDWILLQKKHCLASEAGDRLLHVSQAFSNLGNSSHQELVELFEDARAGRSSQTLTALSDRLAQDSHAPELWINFLKKGIRAVDQKLAANLREDPFRGTPAGTEGRELTDLWRGFWNRFAEALQAWPEIRKAAKDVIN